jgi:hypothetical protein
MRKFLVIVAACAVASLAGANLLTNGGFESGASGWTQYSSFWGSGFNWNYAYTPAYEGSAALSLTAGTDASMGVYEVIDVSPGLPVNISWAIKATDNGNNWYEVLLFDGAKTGVEIEFTTTDPDRMFRWESAALGGGYDGLPQPTWTTGSNSRTPTGTQMTVAVRAAGLFGSGAPPDGQFDALEVIQIPEPTAILLGFGGIVAVLRRRRRQE